MTIKIASLLTTAALSLTIGLAGCSSSQTPQAGTPATGEPSSSAPASPTTAASPTEMASPTEASTGSTDEGGKPAKAAIVAGLTGFYVKSQGLSRDKAKKFATCMVDELYDKASIDTLEGLMTGDPSKVDKGDAGLIGAAGNTCQSALS